MKLLFLFLWVGTNAIVIHRSFKQNSSVLGDDYSYGIYEMDFQDTNLSYYTHFGGYCQNRPADGSCPAVLSPGETCACDYTDPNYDFCSPSYSPSSHPCNCPAADSTYCTALRTQGPITLTPGKNVTLVRGSSLFLIRFFVDPSNCGRGYVLRQISDDFEPQTFGMASPDKSTNVLQIPYPRMTLICPGDYAWGKTASIVMGDSGWDGERLTFKLETVALPPVRAASTCSPPPELASTHTCIPSGREFAFTNVTQPTLLRFVVPVDKPCGTLMWASSAALVKVSLTDPWTYPANSSTALQTRQSPGQNAPGVFGYCFTGTGQHYLYGWIFASPNDTVFFDTNNEWTELRPISEIVSYEFPVHLQAAVTVNCGSKSFTQWVASVHDVSTISDGFANVRFVWPQVDPHPFWPALPYATSWQYQSSLTNPLDLTPRPGKLALIVLLDQRLEPLPSILPSQANYRFMTLSEFETCTLQFNGIITNSNGPIFDNVKTFKNGQGTCNASDYRTMSSYVGDLLTQSDSKNPAPTLQQQSQIGYLVDLALQTNVWYYCRDYLNSFGTLEETQVYSPVGSCVADFGSPQFDADVCCTSTVGTLDYFLACTETVKLIPQEVLTLSVDMVDEAYPKLPQCAAQSLQLLNDLQNRQRNPKVACTYTDKSTFDQQRSNAWYSCFYPAFGMSPFISGTPCTHDSECPDTNLCVAQTKTCALNQTKQSISFLNCIIDTFRNVDPYVLLNTCNRLNVDCAENENRTRNDIAIDLFEALPLTSGCSFKDWMNYDASFQSIAPPTSLSTGVGCAGTPCPPIQISWFFSSDEFPLKWDCLKPANPACVLSVFESEPTCTSPLCNYNGVPARSSFLCQAGYFCGICDADGAACKSLGDTDANGTCPTDLCILANNTIVELGSAACLAEFGCTTSSATPITSEAQCNSTGSCSDATDPIYAVFDGAYGTYTGACIVDIRIKSPYALGRSFCAPPFRSTVLGCLSYTATTAECLNPTYNFGFDTTFYSAHGVKWVKKATTEAECMAYGTKCYFPQASHYPSSITDIVVNSTFPCDPSPLYVWTPGKWYPGMPRTGSGPIVKSSNRTADTGFSTSPGVFDARKLYQMFQEEMVNHFSLVMRSEIFCRTAEEKRITDDLFCVDDCYEKSQGFITTQSGVACSQDENPMNVWPFFITLSNNSLPSGVCQLVLFATTSITLYQDNTAVQFNTVLLSPTEETSWVIRNDNQAIYGKVLTDGMGVDVEYPMLNATLCILWNQKHENWQDSLTKYPRLDVAAITTVGSRTMYPLGMNNITFLNESVFCVSGLDIEANITYFFVMTVDASPQEILVMTRDPWTSGEIGYISVILALYCLGFTISLLGFIATFAQQKFLIEIYLIFITLIVFFIFRIVLFGIALGSPYSLTHPAVGYLLVEFPLILFFAFVSLFIITWSMVIRKGIDHESSKKWIKMARLLATIFLIIVFGFFILLIILFNTLVAPPTLICRDSILYYDSDTAFAMVMAYRATFSTFAFILGTCLFVVGFMIIKIIIDPEIKVPLWTQIKVSLATVFGTFGLFAQAIYYLVLTATRGYHQSTYLSLSILLIDEVIPALLFMACLVSLPSPRELLSSKKSKSKTRTSASRTPSSSSKAGSSVA